MSAEFRFYRINEIRCPRCGSRLDFLHAQKDEPLLVQHPKAECPLAEKYFYAAPLAVTLTEFVPEASA